MKIVHSAQSSILPPSHSRSIATALSGAAVVASTAIALLVVGSGRLNPWLSLSVTLGSVVGVASIVTIILQATDEKKEALPLNPIAEDVESDGEWPEWLKELADKEFLSNIKNG